MADHLRALKEVRQVGEATIAVLDGEFDMHRTPALHEGLVQVCQRQPPLLIIDLSGVGYIDSSGVGALVDVFRRVNAYKGRLVLVGMIQRVRSVFEITRLDQFFETTDSIEEALTE